MSEGNVWIPHVVVNHARITDYNFRGVKSRPARRSGGSRIVQSGRRSSRHVATRHSLDMPGWRFGLVVTRWLRST